MNSASVLGSKTLNNRDVQAELRLILSQPDYNKHISEGLQHILSNHEHRRWIQAAEFVAKIRGDFAPEKHEVQALNTTERHKRFEQVLDRIEQIERQQITNGSEPDNKT